MKRFLSAIISLLLSSVVVFAQTSIDVQAPNLVEVGEQFQITFSIEGENSPSDFSWNQGSDFDLVWGPQRGSSVSTTIVNGKRTRTSQTSYTYIVTAKRAGKFNVPQASATLSGSKIVSRQAVIEVVAGGASSGGQGGSASQQGSGSGSQSGQVSSDDLFMRLNFSKTSAVVGEIIKANLKLYSRVNIAGFENAKLPIFNGFWNQQQIPDNIEFTRENYQGSMYYVATIRSYTLIPQQAGDLVVEPSELVCLVNERVSRNSSRSIFDDFFQDDYRTIRKRVTTPSVTVHVKALPSGAPASFCGGVGNFSISARLTKDSLKTHDAGSLVITVSGTGNISMLETPKVSLPLDFESYDIKVTDETGGDKSRTSGSKVFEYPFIPRSAGEFTIEPVEYSYYDISSRKYVTVHTDPMNIRVEKGNEKEVSGPDQMLQSTARKSVRDLGSDIRYIVTEEPSYSLKGGFYVFSIGFWVILALLVSLGAGIFFLLKRYASRKADVVASKNRAATKMARKRLSVAGNYLASNLYTAFYEELHRALLGYVGDKLGIDPAGMSKDNISEKLVSAGTGEGLAGDFISLLDECEFARYAPDAGHDAMNEHYEKAVSLISTIDSTLKKTTDLKKIVPLLALLLCIPVGAAEWDDAVNAYAAEDWQTAIDNWTAIENGGVESVDLYYNIGNAYFKAGDVSRAILYYERAKRLDPSNEDVSHNLEFARSFTQDRIDEIPEIFIEQVGKKICRTFSSNTWTVLFFVFLSLAIVCALLYLLSSGVARKKFGFYSGIVLLLISLLCLDFAQWQWSDYRHDNSAIVMSSVISVKSSPSGESSKDLFILHDGTKVKILDQVGEWNNIELSDGRQGWVRNSDIEII